MSWHSVKDLFLSQIHFCDTLNFIRNLDIIVLIWFQKGVVIVDTPGIDGWGNIDQRLQTYFSRASGFIYVINMITAAADQQSRVC
jgi:hypothetical protein